MPPLDPAVADVRRAVRATLRGLAPGTRVHAAVSGGADSLALLHALAWEGSGRAVTCVTIDHGLHGDSAAQAARVVAAAEALGVPAVAIRVAPEGADENAARTARYAALDDLAAREGAVVLLGHTRDDQAETVLLGLARGSGARSLAGMARERGPYRRPFLDLPRATTRRACEVLGLDPWDDPANADPRWARTRARALLPVLEDALGPGVTDALARTAAMLRADADLLDDLAGKAYADTGLDTRKLAALPTALRTRVLRRAAIDAGCPGNDLTYDHVRAIDALVTHWRGQGPVHLPGGLVAVRPYGTLDFLRK